MFDIGDYLDRIGYKGPREPSTETLHALHVAHLLAVPFENLDIHLGRPIVLDEGALYQKIVKERRGGFCYELNGLFSALLRELGFRVTLLAASVTRQSGGFGPEFDHLTLKVDLEAPWLADVGFGDSFREPLKLREAEQNGYRLSTDGKCWTLLRHGADKGWREQYRFTLQPRSLPDFADMCLYHQTSPESHFTHNRLCTRATPDGRITLTGLRFIVTEGGERTEHTLSNKQEYVLLLREKFGIVLQRIRASGRKEPSWPQ
jgi:N-hydroxyarylamine O-acetyltransferase